MIVKLTMILALPVLAWALARVYGRIVLDMRGDPHWQAPIAALAAMLPGILLLTHSALGLFAAGTALLHRSTADAAAFAAFCAVGAIVLIAVGNAMLHLGKELQELRHLCRGSGCVDPRLSSIAHEFRVRAEVLDDSVPLCALTGFPPRVFVSTGALALLDDAQLRAALAHECAHKRRFDHLIAPLVVFVTALFPLPDFGLVRAYRIARERSADERAAAVTSPEDLAAALLAFARRFRQLRAAIAFACDDTLEQRIERILERDGARALNWQRYAALLCLGLSAMLSVLLPALWPGR